MKNIVSVLLKNKIGNREKMAWVSLPLADDPFKAASYFDRLYTSLKEDNSEGYNDDVACYRTLLGTAPDVGTPTWRVEEIAEYLQKLTPEQVESLITMFRVFGLNFMDMSRFINFLDNKNPCAGNEFWEEM